MAFLDKWRKTEHQWVGESLSGYIDHELSAEDSQRVEKHLEECRACRENLATLRQTVNLIRDLPEVPAPRSFAVRPMPRTERAPARPSWGYGLLRGATALAALLLMLLVGGDLALHFVAPSLSFVGAPAPQATWAPTQEAELAPAASEEQPLLGMAKGTESPSGGAEEMAPAAPEPTAAADNYQTVPAEVSPPAGAGGAEPSVAPTVAPTEPPVEERVPLVAAGGEATPVAEGAPTPTAEEDGQRAAISLPTGEAMAEAAEREEPASRATSALSALSPLRFAELIVLAVLVVLAAATALTAWRRRRAA
jgi:anti-sigma factor RsiW